jgi:hypothetical protein
MAIIPATQEAEISMISVQNQPWANKPITKRELVEWLKL